MKARVYVTLKEGVLDPQGQAIKHALGNLDFNGVNDVRQGKMFDIELDHKPTEAELEKMCETLLANTVIESYRVEIL